MSIELFPGMNPEERRRQAEEAGRRRQEWLEERRQSLEQALAVGDVMALAARWREEVASACEKSFGPDSDDIEDMSRITLALAVVAATEGRQHENLSRLHVVLGEFNGSLRHARHEFGVSQPLARLRQAAALEINALIIARRADSARAGNRPPTADERAAAHDANVAHDDSKGIVEDALSVSSPAGAQEPRESGPNDGLEFTAVEKAIVLLLRDGCQPRSMRDYAKDVGVAHTTLGRNEAWQRAWDVAQKLVNASPDSLPSGSKDAEGNLDAWIDERCENCRQERITGTITVSGEPMRVCEKCTQKLSSRTIPRSD